MASKKFTEEEMNHLRASSYVLDVSLSIVHFTAEFKKKFWEAILTEKNRETSLSRWVLIQIYLVRFE